MADLGQGRFHLTDRAANLPQIFTQETTAIQRSYLIEERFFPTLTSNSPILSGIRQVPPLYGYVGTSAKATAQLILETHMGDPLLAAWQYGLGRAVAWTSDASGRWAREWVQWAGFPTFWAQAVRWSITQGRDSNLESIVTYGGEQAQVTVDARSSDGRFLNNLTMQGNVVGPEGDVVAMELQQVAPGRYTGIFTPMDEGAYLVRVTGTAPAEDTVVAQTIGWVLGYSPEYRQFSPNLALLQELAVITGGRELGDQPGAAFDHTLQSEPTTRPIWPWLTLLAALLLPVDVGVRRLALGRRDLARAWTSVSKRWQREAVVPERSEQVARLFEAKERATAAQTREEGQSPPPPSGPEPATTAAAASPHPQTPSPSPEPPAPGTDSSLASRLLERRRRQQEEPPNN
jgi:hypothetical protein